MSDTRIQELTLEEVMGDRFGRYSKSIIQERALPDIRDGLKPVQRRILFAMNKDGNTYEKTFRKSAKSVGNVMGNFHPHGDSSIYEALVRMSQDWKLREPLIEMHGNNGSMDGDPPAAMRYTEARLSKIAGLMLQDIDKDTVEMVLNFDDTENEPTVLPARLPNLLVNGATGISAGYATEIPPHNLAEVIDGLVYLLANPDASLDQLMDFVKAPDFPTGGIIQGMDGVKKAYETGRGRIVVRAKTAIEGLKGGKQQIRVTEIPYEVNKAQLVKRIDELRIAKKVEGLAEVRDETDRTGLSIAIELKRNVNAQGILNYLFKNTDLQINYNFNMVAIDQMRPKRVGLKKILASYLQFQKEIITKRTQFDLNKAQKRLHIVEGLIKALSILDQVIATIRASQNRKDAKQNLVDQYDFTEDQAEAIVTLQLYRLTNTDVTELEDEQAKLTSDINTYQSILTSDKKLAQVLKKELLDVKKQFGNPRKTSLEEHVEELKIDTKVTVAKEDVIVLVSHDGYMKRSSVRSYTASDSADNGLKEDDYAIFTEKTNTLSHLFMFTNKGHLIYRPVHEIADQKWKDTGEHISQTIGLDADEQIINVMAFDSLKETGNFLMATNDGQIKQTSFADYLPGRSYKKHASIFMKLKNDSSRVLNVQYFNTSADNRSVLLMSQSGLALRFDLSEVPVTGARTTGVKSMGLRGDDQVVNLAVVTENQDVAIITDRGAYKQLKISDIPVTSRARKGVLVLRELKTNPHQIADFIAYDDDFEGAFEIITDRPMSQDVLVNEHPFGSRYSNGSFILDVDTQGTPVIIRPKDVALVL
ncbi:DNA topoisomerase IV subunit A [Paucilactobacillus sp. N302-9]